LKVSPRTHVSTHAIIAKEARLYITSGSNGAEEQINLLASRFYLLLVTILEFGYIAI
jgi:hypothetical protein